MTSTVYWFSGTGNSFAVARDIAEGIKGRLVPIASAVKADRIAPDSEVLGIVFPAYYVPFGGLPQMVKRFVGRLHGLESKYVFGVCTYGSAETNTLAVLGRMLAARGGRLAGRFAVNMPENIYPELALKKHPMMFETWKKDADRVCGLILNRRRGFFGLRNFLVGPAYPLANLIGIPFRLLMKNHTVKHLQLTSGSTLETYDELMPLMDSGFSASDKCVGCGTCAKVCPAANIRIAEGRPAWLHRCEYCLACYNWCPKEAIEGKGLKSALRYRHPGVRAADLMTRDSLRHQG
jgi:Pyruvate/2-oxoacid:ferredoxin oxidoreductase delta subunit/flavodoxin